MKYMYNSAMGYHGKAHESQTAEESHRPFLNLILKGKLRIAVQFVCDREKEEVFQPNELAEYCSGMIEKTVTLVLEGKYPIKTVTSCATLEPYKETPIFICI